MAVSPSSRIFRAEHKSYDGTEWRVDIHDSTVPGTNTRETVLTSEGINFRSEGKNELYDWIHPMTAEFTLMIQTQDHEDTVDAFAASGPQRYYVFIYKDGARYFTGMVVNETVEIEDTPRPYGFKIRAIDGLSVLRDQLYDNNGTPVKGYAEVSRILTRCLTFMPTSGFYDNDVPPTTPFMLITAMRWYENSMNNIGGADSLEQQRVKQEVFDKRQEFADEPEPMTAWEVLEQICIRYAARLYYAEGSYWFVQPDIMADGATFTAWKYLRGATNSTTSATVGGSISVYDSTNTSATAAPLTGGVFNFYKAVKEVKLRTLYGNPNLNFDGTEWDGDGIYTNDVITSENINATDIVINGIDTTSADVIFEISARMVVFG